MTCITCLQPCARIAGCLPLSRLLVSGSPTKASIAAAIIFVLDKKTDIISLPHALVYFGITIFFVYFKVTVMRVVIRTAASDLQADILGHAIRLLSD